MTIKSGVILKALEIRSDSQRAGDSTVVQECILAGTNAIYDFSCFVIKTIISRYFGILRICEFHLPLNQTLFYTCTDIPNLTYHDFYKIHIKF